MAPGPTLEQRLASREAGGSAIMFQRWENLLFLHWNYDPEALAARLPPGLHLDLHMEQAYIGIVPFFMKKVRPRFLPCVPGLSSFQELNLRTYVHDDEGVPGVWFFSLDAGNAIAVALARRFFHLPYRRAHLTARIDSRIDYRCSLTPGLEFRYEYDRPADGPEAEPGSLDFFLLERYHLYAHDTSSGRIFRGRVHHAPYRFSPAVVTRHDTFLFDSNGLPAPEDPPCHQVAVAGVDVSIYPLRPLRRA